MCGGLDKRHMAELYGGVAAKADDGEQVVRGRARGELRPHQSGVDGIKDGVVTAPTMPQLVGIAWMGGRTRGRSAAIGSRRGRGA